MNFLTNIFKEIEEDFNLDHYKKKNSLSRRIKYQNGYNIIFYFNRNCKSRSVAIELNEEYDENIIKKLPKWKGLEQRICNIIDDGESKHFLFFEQLESYETYIYELVMADVINNLKCSSDNKYIEKTLYNILNKWKKFFQSEIDIIMSDIKQQGLYSELLFLEQLIDLKGSNSVLCWTGGDAETHDFYVETNAIEIKSTSLKGPFTMSISSEYQLDTKDIVGSLYVVFIALRKSIADGEKLPIIVERIIMKLLNNEILINEFKEKLFKYGYLIDFPKLYNLCFAKREERYYIVNGDFPRITTVNIQKGIGSINYQVSLEACEKYKISFEKLINAFGGIINGNGSDERIQ